ncbi:MAG: hypothetical protein LBR10_08935 [Prevotellaceae bacterium]|nr:hypothetical protein [Prevotellaceae bacterium]
MCFCLSLQAQTNAEHKRHIDNYNRRYYQDIVLERGLYIPTTDNSMSEGYITSLYSGYFITHNLGFRSGVSMITDLNNGSPYLKLPVLFTLRSPTLHISYHRDDETFGEYLRHLILYLLPTRYEINLGPSLGYVWNNRRNFAASLDLNIRAGFQFWRIGLYGNMGINYLLTKNFVNRDIIPRGKSRPGWFGNLSLGASFGF